MDTTQLQRIKQRYGIVGNNEALNRALDIALKIAPVDLSVLVTGENGVGKEIFPRIIHDNSLRKNKKYLAVNCGAIPEGTIDSELFGHEKGAFTGAVSSREGYFSVADGGTLFLDEVGELPLSTQARLLRVLETGEYIRVGASEVRKTDVRIIAATNVNVDKAIAEGKFREDLYYRLNSVSISVPPLRGRGEDIALLFRKFAMEMSERYRMPALRLDDDAKQLLIAYPWPGNVRQLRNITENMSITAEEREITPEILRDYLPEVQRSGQLVAARPKSESRSFENEREILYQILFDLRRDVSELKKIVHGASLGTQQSSSSQSSADHVGLGYVSGKYLSGGKNDADAVRDAEAEELRGESLTSLEDLEKKTIRDALIHNNGRRKETAQQLGISERTLYRKIKEYGME